MAVTPSESWSSFFKDELDEQFEVKKRLEERAEKVVAGNGTIVTLLFAIAAIVVSTDAKFRPSGIVLFCLAVALVGFGLSAVLAFWVSRPREYLAPDEDDLIENVINDDSVWADDAVVETNRSIAEVRLAMTLGAIEQNNAKARFLSRSIGAAAVGIAALSVALFIGLAQ